jgi:hypothetical protein
MHLKLVSVQMKLFNQGASTMSNIPLPSDDTLKVYLATRDDVPGIVHLTKEFAHESGSKWIRCFDKVHAERHMLHIIDEGVCFVAAKGNLIIGMIACLRIDTGFTYLPDLETVHIYICPAWRKSRAIFRLFDEVENFGAKQNCKIFFHQTNYPAAIDGVSSNSSRVETLYKRRDYHGPIDVVYTCPDFVRVGITYLHDLVKAREEMPKIDELRLEKG